MSTYDDTGISMDGFAVVLKRYQDSITSRWGKSAALEVDQLLGHFADLNALVVSEINQIVQKIADGQSVSSASDGQLDGLLELVGLDRIRASSSTAVLTLTASGAVTVPAGSLYSTSADVTFETDDELIFAGAGSDTVDATCTVTGVKNASIGEINVLTQSPSGITACTNAVAAVPGRAQATNAEMKVLHTEKMDTAGLSDRAAISEALAETTGVSSQIVNVNDTGQIVDGIDPYCINCVVIGGSPADIAAAIYNTKITSVPTFGSTTVSHYDSETGDSKDINFDIGSTVLIYHTVNYSKIAGTFPAEGASQIQAAIVDHYSTFRIGQDVSYNALYAPVYSVAGVILNSLNIGLSASPGGTSDIPMDGDQLAYTTTIVVEMIETA